MGRIFRTIHCGTVDAHNHNSPSRSTARQRQRITRSAQQQEPRLRNEWRPYVGRRAPYRLCLSAFGRLKYKPHRPTSPTAPTTPYSQQREPQNAKVQVASLRSNGAGPPPAVQLTRIPGPFSNLRVPCVLSRNDPCVLERRGCGVRPLVDARPADDNLPSTSGITAHSRPRIRAQPLYFPASLSPLRFCRCTRGPSRRKASDPLEPGQRCDRNQSNRERYCARPQCDWGALKFGMSISHDDPLSPLPNGVH